MVTSASIWKDKIILDWNGQLPPGAPSDAVHSQDDVVHFWEHLRGFCKWSKRAGGFTLNFSKQNLKRIHAQFGQVPIRQGGDLVAQLKQAQANFYDMVQKVQKIKTLPIERLPVYNYKMPPLGEYQHRGAVLMVNAPMVPLFADCGMGKTWMVLTSTEKQLDVGLIERGKILVCAKLATLESGWMEDCAKFTNLRMQMLWAPNKKRKGYNRRDVIIERLNTPADLYVINHDGVRFFEEELAAKKFQKVVVDESTILKGFHGMFAGIKGGQFGRALMRVSEHAKWRVVMSGTPAPNGPSDLWGQFYFLDPNGLVLHPSFNDFMEEFYEVVDLRPMSKRYRGEGKDKTYIPMRHDTPRKQVPKKDAVQKVSDLIAPVSYRLRIRDHLKDLPPLTVIKRKLEMTEDQTKHYQDMKDLLKVVIGDTRITVPIRLAQAMKLRQITGGFIIDNQEKEHEISGNPKLAELDSLLNEEIAADEKVVIYAQYQYEIRMIEERYKRYGTASVYGGNSSEKNLKNIDRFIKDPSVRIIVLHPKSAAHGITFTMAHYMIFYSISHSEEDNYQSKRRIERAGQKEAMFVYYLLCKDSIDEAIYRVLQQKANDQENLIDSSQALLNILEGA